LYKHHQEAIAKITAKMQKNEDVLALIIAGSIAHGFAAADADVDIMIVVSQEEYERRYDEKKLVYFERESCNYEGGYIDGKYISVDYIKEVAQYGSEPEKFAFKDAYIAFSRIPGLEELIKEATRYPMEYKKARMSWFYAKFHEWYWFYEDGLKKKNPYLITTAIANMVLCGGRAILAYNELLFPYHKWFLRVLEGAAQKPDNLMSLIYRLLEERSPAAAAALVKAIDGFTDWGIKSTDWAQFVMGKNELGAL
jgi:predicted nucleotidyltransferase